MLEVLVLAAIIVLFPPRDGHLIPIIVGLAVTLPGLYAMLTGAPFVPTTRPTLKRMMELAKIKRGEKVYDLGCGDGRLVFAAARAGAHAVGYEYSIPTFAVAKLRSLFRPRTRIAYADMWKQDYDDGDVLFCYLLTDAMQTFQKNIWPTLKPGTRVVSHAFKMKDVKPTTVLRDAVLYVKPAKSPRKNKRAAPRKKKA